MQLGLNVVDSTVRNKVKITSADWRYGPAFVMLMRLEYLEYWEVQHNLKRRRTRTDRRAAGFGRKSTFQAQPQKANIVVLAFSCALSSTYQAIITQQATRVLLCLSTRPKTLIGSLHSVPGILKDWVRNQFVDRQWLRRPKAYRQGLRLRHF